MRFLTPLLACLLVSSTQADEIETGFAPMFDGETLNGWKQVGGTANYRVEGNEIVDPQGRKRGKLALQLHGGQDVDVRFKDVEILEPTEGVGRP